MFVLEFEKPIVELRSKIDDLKKIGDKKDINLSDEIQKLEKKVMQLERVTFQNLDSWQKTQLARHPQRPYTLDFIKECASGFIELHGDRKYSDDPAIVGGLAKLNEISVMIIGHQKARTTKDKLYRNFGMPNPEGYRKALRLMQLAEKFGIPIVTLIDTPGAYPGMGAEERGQSEAIAANLSEMAGFSVPIVCVVLGEGGSGGALALGVGNRILMLEYSFYSVITPEGCASILWGDGKKAQDAAKSLKYTARDLEKMQIIDRVIPEPVGGAHTDIATTLNSIKEAICEELNQLNSLTGNQLIEDRYERFRQIGVYVENG